jgi:Tfp pilus assembly protein PilF
MRYCLICKTCYDDEIAYCETEGAQTAKIMPGARVLDGKYEITRLLGQGGMGAVFEAVQRGIERQVAVKLINPSFVSNEQALERFKREALASGRVKHPNAITVYDFGVTGDGVAYLAMEFLTGKSLRDVLAEERVLAPERVVEILAPVCSAVESAHRQGIVHRDLKPDNVFLESLDDGSVTPKVLDFGIAKLRTPQPGAPDLTGEGSSIGTPAYMSPEQAKGLQLDARSDVYALGVIAYEMLSGALPFQSTSPMGYLVQHMMEAPIPLSAANPKITGAVEEAVMRALDKSPEARPQSALDFVRALSAACEAKDAPRGGGGAIGFDQTVSFLRKLGAETVAAGRATVLERQLLGWPVGTVPGVAPEAAAVAFADLARELVAAAAQRVPYPVVFEGARRWVVRRVSEGGLYPPNATPVVAGAAPKTAGLAFYCAQDGLSWSARMPSGAELPLLLRAPGDEEPAQVTRPGVATWFVPSLPGGSVATLVARLEGRQVWSGDITLVDGATSLVLCVPQPDATATQNPEMFAHLFGTLEINANVGGAEIFVDDGPVPWGITVENGPALLYCVVPGTHRVSVRKAFHRPSAGEAEVVPGARTIFTARLEQLIGWLRVLSTIPGPAVEVVGPEPSQEARQVEAGEAIALSAGVYLVRAVLEGYMPWVAQVEVRPDEERRVQVSLALVPCPICGQPAAGDSFTCPACKRDRIHAFHRYGDGPCIDCAARAAFDRAGAAGTVEAWRSFVDAFGGASAALTRRAEAEVRRITDRAREKEVAERAERFAKLAMRGEIVAVVESWSSVVRERPNDPEARLALAAALEAFGRRDAALVEYAAAAERAPGDPFVHRELGRVLAVMRRPADAVREYSAAVAIKPDFAEAHFELANLLLASGQIDAATEGFRTAAWLRPDHAAFHESYGRALADRGRFREAAEAFQLAASCHRRDQNVALAERAEQWAASARAQTPLHKAGKLIRELIDGGK